MKKIAIIGASYLQLPLIEKAKNMGYETHVFAWAADDVGEKAADYFYPVSIIEKEQVLEICRHIEIDGICSIASDLAIITVNYVAEKMGLYGNSMESTFKCTNKYQMRKTFFEKGDPSPQSIAVNNKTNLLELDISYPVIVKPTDRSGSRGVHMVFEETELKNAVSKALNESFEKSALVEEYVEGKEYSVEYISFQGEHHYLAVTEKFTTGFPHFIETAHLEPALLDEITLAKVKRIVEHALDSLSIVNGASHSEIKIDSQNNIKIIEIGARMGGDCIGSDLVRLSTGIDFVKAVIQVSLGQEPDLFKRTDSIAAKSVFLLTEEDVKEMQRIQAKDPENIIKIVEYHPERAGRVTDSSNRAGCYIIRMAGCKV